MADTDPRHGYVRFYLSTLAQLDGVREALEKSAAELKASVEPFGDVLAVAGDDAALAPLSRTTLEAASSTASLWRPDDPALLTGITDVYDVIGRFSFQGEDDANLVAMRAVLDAQLVEVERQRGCLTALARVPARATQKAEGLSQQELAAQETARAAKLAPFEPVAQQLREQCTTVLTAVRNVPKPNLADLATAETLYQDYVRKVQALYAKGLPYLRRGLEQVCAAAQVDVPPNWPEVLPFAATLPQELVANPPQDTPESAEARARLQQIDAQEQSLRARIEESTSMMKRTDAERAEIARQDAELNAEHLTAKNIVRWAARWQELDAAMHSIGALSEQRQARVALLAQLYAQLRSLQSTATTARAEVSSKESELAEAQATLSKEKSNPPALFGKDEWRKRVQELEEEVDELRAALQERKNAHGQALAESASVQARAQTEQGEIAVVERALQETREREQLMRKEISELEAQLGPALPASRVASQHAEEQLAQITHRRNDLRGRLADLAARARRLQEEQEYVASQMRQLAPVRDQLREITARADEDAARTRAEALRALAEKRKVGFEQYVATVLGPLEESLSQVERVFIEPARQVLLQRADAGGAHKAGSLRAQAEGLAQAVAQLLPRVEPALAAQVEALRRVQGEFLDKVREAVSAAWAA